MNRFLKASLTALFALAAPAGLMGQNLGARPDTAVATPTAPLNYRLDASASNVSAKVPFFGIASKTARFPRMEGSVSVVPGAPERAMIDVTFDAMAIEAPDPTTLQRLRGERFFWVERYPTIRFVGRSLRLTSPTRGKLTGELTARGVTNTETLDVTFASDPTIAGRRPIQFTAEMAIDRRDYGMKSYQLIVGNTVDITLRAQMVPR